LKLLPSYLVSIFFVFVFFDSSAQVFKGKVSFWGRTAPCTLQLNADSSLNFVWSDKRNDVYEQYAGYITNFHKDLFRLRTRKPVRREGWGLLDMATGKEYRYAQVLIDTFHRKTFAPVQVVYEDGSIEIYPFKGQMKLDTNKLNAAHPSYTLGTQRWSPFNKKALSFVGTYTSNICVLNDTSGVDVFVRFKKDSLVTVPDEPYERYNYFFRLRQNNWRPPPVAKEATRRGFTYPDISPWRLSGDSLVYSDEIEIKYGTDTVRSKAVSQYFKNKYVSTFEVSQENGVIDSSVFISVFDEKGIIKRSISRWFSELWCDSSLSTGDGYNQWVDYGERIAVEDIHFACPRYSYAIVDYKKDTIGVKRTLNYNHEYKTLNISADTTWYLPNGRKRLERSYTDTVLNYSRRYHDVYDETGKLKQMSERVTHQNGYEVSQLMICLGGDTVPVKSTTRYKADSTVGEYIIYQYHPESKIGWFKFYSNGKVNRYSVLLPAPEGCTQGSVTRAFDQDSLLVSGGEMNCFYEKKSKGTLERWSGGRDQTYYRSDTVKTKTGYLVKTYTRQVYSVYPDFKSEALSTCQLKYTEVQDRFRRNVVFTEYEDNNTVKKKVKYRYSRP